MLQTQSAKSEADAHKEMNLPPKIVAPIFWGKIDNQPAF
jgi:hypothetical protein